jgi:hypothetical protein
VRVRDRDVAHVREVDIAVSEARVGRPADDRLDRRGVHVPFGDRRQCRRRVDRDLRPGRDHGAVGVEAERRQGEHVPLGRNEAALVGETEDELVRRSRRWRRRSR